MTFNTSLILDIVLALLLLVFLIRGVKRGGIMTLCSLAAIIVALFGGWTLSSNEALQMKLASLGTLPPLAIRPALFLGGFLAVLILWLIVCWILDLVARLPVLHILNKCLGGLLGLIEGILLLKVLCWVLCDLTHWIPESIIAGSYLLPYLRISLF